MKKIKIFDTTLRDGEQAPGYSMTDIDKIKLAKKLNDMKVDIIEAGFAASNHNDFMAIKNMALVVDYSTLCSLARCNEKDIYKAYEAIKDAKNKRIHTFIGTSPTHMKYKLKMTKSEILDTVWKNVNYAKKLVDDVEFSLEDATRTDKDFACSVINTAIEAGATTINIPDTVGYVMPDEFRNFIKYLKQNSNLFKVDVSVHCHNDLGLATANSLAAILEGVNQIECTVNGIGERAGNTSLEEVVANIDTRYDYYNAYTDIVLKNIYDISKTVCQVTNQNIQKNKAIVGDNAFKHEAGIHQQGVINDKSTYEIMNPSKYGINTNNIVIGIHSGRNAIIEKIKNFNYNPDNYDINSILDDIKNYYEVKLKYNNDKNEISDNEFISIINNHKYKTKIR